MKKPFRLLLCLALLFVSGCSSYQKTIRFGAADIGGIYYTFANTFTGLASSEDDTYQFEVKTTAGSAANLRLLSGGYIELGLAQSDLIASAYEGSGIFEGNPCQGYSAIAGLYTEACQIVVRADSNIQTLDDLQGKTVSIGAEDSGTEQNANQILTMSGLTTELVKTVNLDYTDAADQLINGKIDAFFCTAGIQTTVLSAYPSYSEYTIPANTYTGQTEDIHTLGVKAVLLASDRLSTDTVEHLTEWLFSHAKDLQYATSLNLQLDETYATDGIPIPFHPGAVAYYEKQGITLSSESNTPN